VIDFREWDRKMALVGLTLTAQLVLAWLAHVLWGDTKAVLIGFGLPALVYQGIRFREAEYRRKVSLLLIVSAIAILLISCAVTSLLSIGPGAKLIEGFLRMKLG
jgi:hypothetical protein